MATRVGLDGRALGNINRNRGIGRYTARMVEALAARADGYELVLFGYGAGPDPGLLDRSALAAMRWREIPISGNVEFYGGPLDHLRFAREIDRSGVALFHGMDHNMTPFVPCRSLVTVHDLVPLVLRGPYLGPRSRAWLRSHRRACRRANAVIAVSEATGADVRRLWGIPPERIAVVPEGVSAGYRPAPGDSAGARRVAEKLRLREPYFLYVGGFDPRKNIYNMLLGYKRYRLRGGEAFFALCGDTAGHGEDLADMVEELGVGGSVLLPGFVEDRDMPALYSAARALLFVSLYEGFGLPLLEAMACGAPVIASNVSSIPEVTGGAALLVDPLEPDEIAAAMARLESEPGTRSGLVSLGLERASRFTWDASAGRVLELYGRALGGGP